jgi:hypothetical protein
VQWPLVVRSWQAISVFWASAGIKRPKLQNSVSFKAHQLTYMRFHLRTTILYFPAPLLKFQPIYFVEKLIFLPPL